MSEVFLKVLNMSIAASWLILAVMLLQFVLKRAPKWIAVLLWGIVALRLAVPFSFESALSLIPSVETFNPHNIQYETPAISSGIPAVNNAVNPILGKTFAPNPGSSVNPLYVWTFVVSVIWLIGIAAMLLYAAISYVRVHRSVAERVPYEGNIFLCDCVKSPFILGLVRPKIYLPSNMDAMAMEPVIAHEKAHLARRDHWWKPMGFLILAVHWFNPLCWIAYVLLCRDIELACDEKVIQQMDLDGKKQYSTALLKCSTQRRLVTVCPLAFGEVGVKDRIKSVLNYKKPAFWVVVVAVIACGVVTVCFATNPKSGRTFSMPGRNVSDLEPQKIVEEIAKIENLESGSTLYANTDNFDLQLTSDFDWENDGAIRFFYLQDKKTWSAQLRLFASENQFFVTEHGNWPDQNRIFSLYSYLNALKYLPKEQIRELSPDADSYQVVFLDRGVPEDYDNVITYTPDGTESIDGWLIHLEVQPCHHTPVSYNQSGEAVAQASGAGSVIHLFYGPQGTESQRKLTLDDVVMLSQKGDALTWSDFERYQGQEIGSGLYIMCYEIDELFDVLVGGVPDETPWYISLKVNYEADGSIDIRTEDVSTFIAAHRNDVPKIVGPKPDGGGEPAPAEPDFSNSSDTPQALTTEPNNGTTENVTNVINLEPVFTI